MSRHFPLALPPVAIALAACLVAPAAAQDVDPYARCAAMSGDGERLACFDETYAGAHQMRAEQAAQAEAAREAEYGLTPQDREERRERQAPVDPVVAAQVAADEAEEVGITAKLASVTEDPSGKAVLRLDNGQVWRVQSMPRSMRGRLKDGWSATITRHWSGAYEMRFAERDGVLRVVRSR